MFASCCPESSCGIYEPFTNGCNDAFYNHVRFVFYMVGWTAIGLAILIAVAGLALGVIYSFKRKNVKKHLGDNVINYTE